MNITKKATARNKSLGIYLTFAQTSNPRCVVATQKDGPFRKYVTVYLPNSATDQWEKMFIQSLIHTENGSQWAVRMDWQNVKQFFSIEQVERLESVFSLIPFYLYNAAEIDKREIDIDAIYNAKRREKRKQTISTPLQSSAYEQLL